MQIRSTIPNDLETVRNIHLSAFSEEEREVVAQLAVDLLTEETTPQILSLVAEVDGTICGHVAFSPATLTTSDKWSGYILAPLAVMPDHQRSHIGSQLVQHGITILKELGIHTLFVYGDPGYYGRFGFEAETASRYAPPYPLQYPFGWQALALNDFEEADLAGTISCVEALRSEDLW